MYKFDITVQISFPLKAFASILFFPDVRGDVLRFYELIQIIVFGGSVGRVSVYLHPGIFSAEDIYFLWQFCNKIYVLPFSWIGHPVDEEAKCDASFSMIFSLFSIRSGHGERYVPRAQEIICGKLLFIFWYQYSIFQFCGPLCFIIVSYRDQSM